MTCAGQHDIAVSEEADVVLAGRKAKAVLAPLEFDESTVEEIVLAVHELASNIIKHAGEGTLSFHSRSDAGRAGIAVTAQDTGPGITDVDRAVVDGFSTTGSLGGGLGAVHRLMDEVVIKSDGDEERGVQIVATRWKDEPTPDNAHPSPRVGVVTRPKPGYEQNGDAFLIDDGPEQTLIGVIDGLGHGQEAHRASSAAQQYVRRHSTEPISDIFDGVEATCRSTRGVVMALARFDNAVDHVTIGSVGNITVRECNSPAPRHLVTKRGVIGGNAPNPMVADWEWDPASVLVIHSDGLTSRWQCDEFELHDSSSVTDAARELHRTLSKQDDDATVLVARGGDR